MSENNKPIIEEHTVLFWCPYCDTGYYHKGEAEECRDYCADHEEGVKE